MSDRNYEIGLMDPDEKPQGAEFNPAGDLSWTNSQDENEAVEAKAASIAEKLNKMKKIERIQMTPEEYAITEEGNPFTYEDITALLYKLFPEYGIGKKQIVPYMEGLRRGDSALLFNKFNIDNSNFEEDFGSETTFTYSIKGNYNSGGLAQEIPRTELKKVTSLDKEEFLARFGDDSVETDENGNMAIDAKIAQNVNEKYDFGNVLFDEEKGKFVIDETMAYFDGNEWKVRSQDLVTGEIQEEVVQVPSRNSGVPQGTELEHGFSSN